MNEEQKLRIDSYIKKLDYFEGTGAFSHDKESLSDEFLLFISAGGAGRRALAEVKKTFRQQVDPDCIEKKTMFLAIDSAHMEQDNSVTSGIFSQTEIIKFPYKDAHKKINPDVILPQIKEWVHKDLWTTTGGAGADITPPPEFSGVGTGAKRQCGRVLFIQSSVQQELFQSLVKIQNKLASLGRNCTKIKVIFLAGLAGGTGSGMIIDLAYLTRYYLKTILGVVYHQVQFSAYLLLPSACGDIIDINNRTIGNQNAYAALKEIDYYMTISNRNEHFVMDYGTISARNVDIAENIFDVCTLVEGIGEDGTFYKDSAESARQVIADFILNTHCINKSTRDIYCSIANNGTFSKNQGTIVTDQIANYTDIERPRDANYIYNVIGCSSCIVPTDLIMVYLAKKVFDEVFRFWRNRFVTTDRVTEFLNQCELEPNQLGRKWKTLQKSQLKLAIRNQVVNEIRANGPHYVVELLNESAKMIEDAPSNYLHKAFQNKQGFFVNREKWSRIQLLYSTTCEYLRELSSCVYDIYGYTLDCLRELIDTNSNLLIDKTEYEIRFGESFRWSPINLTTSENASYGIAKYLNSILTEGVIKRLALEFIEIFSNSQGIEAVLEDDLEAVQVDFALKIKQFISKALMDSTSFSFEEFLVKAILGNDDATANYYDKYGKMIPSYELQYSVEMILAELEKETKVLATLSMFSLEETSSSTALLLPSDSKLLDQAVADKSSIFGIPLDNIFWRNSKDRITLCKWYTGIPAWALFWTKDAEENYEIDGPNKVGLHINQGTKGIRGTNLPNLYPEKLWSPTDFAIRDRESAISKEIRGILDRAKKIEMMKLNAIDTDYYDIYLLNEAYSESDLFAMAEHSNNFGYSMSQALDILEAVNYVRKEKIDFIGQVMTTPDASDITELENFRFDMACRTIRRLPHKWDIIKNSLEIFEKLNKIIMMAKEQPQKYYSFGEIWGENREELAQGIDWEDRKTIDLKVPIGFDESKNIVYIDCKNQTLGLVVGPTGSGKSSFYNTFVLSMAYKYSTDFVGFILLDYKSGEHCQMLGHLPHIISLMDQSSEGCINDIFSFLMREIEFRFSILKKYGKTSIDDLHMKEKTELKTPVHIFVMLNNCNDFSQDNYLTLNRIISLGRACGIHIIVSTQAIIDSMNVLWNSATFKIVFQSYANSRYYQYHEIIGHLESRIPGCAVLDHPDRVTVFQTAFVPNMVDGHKFSDLVIGVISEYMCMNSYSLHKVNIPHQKNLSSVEQSPMIQGNFEERVHPYSGSEDYIFVSYSHKNSNSVMPIINRLYKDGFRIWYDEGINPGTEWDEKIASQVQNCSLFIAFLSEEYLASSNCKDELNYARDCDCSRLLVYLDSVELPAGMQMRLGRLQAIYRHKYADEKEFFLKLLDTPEILTCKEDI